MRQRVHLRARRPPDAGHEALLGEVAPPLHGARASLPCAPMQRDLSFDVGPVRISPACVLAPMEGITDRPFRALIRGLGGCGLTVTEFVSSEAMSRQVAKAWKMAELSPDEHPVSIQIYGRDPGAHGRVGQVLPGPRRGHRGHEPGLPEQSRDGSGCAGSARMRHPPLAQRIFAAVRAAITVPMTVKMRLGWDRDCLKCARGGSHRAGRGRVHGHRARPHPRGRLQGRGGLEGRRRGEGQPEDPRAGERRHPDRRGRRPGPGRERRRWRDGRPRHDARPVDYALHRGPLRRATRLRAHPGRAPDRAPALLRHDDRGQPHQPGPPTRSAR